MSQLLLTQFGQNYKAKFLDKQQHQIPLQHQQQKQKGKDYVKRNQTINRLNKLYND